MKGKYEFYIELKNGRTSEGYVPRYLKHNEISTLLRELFQDDAVPISNYADGRIKKSRVYFNDGQSKLFLKIEEEGKITGAQLYKIRLRGDMAMIGYAVQRLLDPLSEEERKKERKKTKGRIDGEGLIRKIIQTKNKRELTIKFQNSFPTTK
jgi:hypothetical protein